ncbi:hemerythrin domain-containing protein [Streptomyces sp. NBC_00237]|uniref:hemerythrin domain-containing protein n=1 Tax=Streptomyces sp. NBC_00237 TaxID=2975687 RepID=UPI00225392E3|nr:hemerythrin domain-containing protein [Streptomyces sp. NBC_00237]MCX5201986.1 hemerythrin domain-containing protein [Streptomyces sp. NBC_00237]
MNDDTDEFWLTRRTGLTPTSPPAERISDRTVLDEPTRPGAPEPDGSVVFDEQGLAAARHFRDMHDMYRKEMRQVRESLRQVEEGARSIGDARDDLNRMSVRANNWALGGICQRQCLGMTGHHTLESDSIFPYLAASQKDLAPVVERLNSEHLAIHGLIEDVDEALIRLVTHPGEFGPLRETLDLLSDTLLSHFAYEERELLGPIARFGLN